MTKCQPFDSAMPVRKSGDHVAIEVDGDVMLMSASQGRYIGLDEIGSDIWRRLEKPQTVTELCDSLAGDYDAEPGDINRDVRNLLTSLVGYGLLEPEARR